MAGKKARALKEAKNKKMYSRMKKVVGAVFLLLIAISVMYPDTKPVERTAAESIKSANIAPSVPWNTYGSTVKSDIDALIKAKDCLALKDRKRLGGRGELMDYLEWGRYQAHCYDSILKPKK